MGSLPTENPSDDDEDNSKKPKSSKDDVTKPTNAVDDSQSTGTTASGSSRGSSDTTNVPVKKEVTFSDLMVINGCEERERSMRRPPVLFSFAARSRPRQPFMNQPRPAAAPAPVPPPPSYYRSEVTSGQHQPGQLMQSNGQRSRESPATLPPPPPPPRDQNVLLQNRMNFRPGEATMIPNTMLTRAFWAPYPDKIPPNIPACLAHLLEADTLFITQQIDIVELFISVEEPNFYLIQNKFGQCIYYAYETTSLFGQAYCSHKRALQLHIMDVYHNEIIYMNKPCGCNDCFCCYPALEVYSPPLVPIGAIIKKFRPLKQEFLVLDADENLMFKIIGPSWCTTCGYFAEVEFTIHALDQTQTEIGIIKREWGGMARAFLPSDYYGITFPKDLDVRIKAIFLGALFLIVSKLTTRNRRKPFERNNATVTVFRIILFSKISQYYNRLIPEYESLKFVARIQIIGGWQSGDNFISEFKKGGDIYINKVRGNGENLKMSLPSNSANVISFLQLIGKLKSLKRTGWVLKNVEDPETVSGHMYRMSVMTFLIPETSGVDKTRCMKLSIVHDLAECIVGDLTPFCGVDASEKHRQEDAAMKELTQMIGDSGAEIYKLYKEYEAQVTDESKFVKDLDRLDLILQAFEYENLSEKPGNLEEFFASTLNKFHFPWTIDIVKEIYKQRNLSIKKGKI